jgi:hypothetical protein
MSFVESALDALSPYAAWLVGVSVFLLVGCLVLIPVLVARLRADYFVNPEPPTGSFRASHPLARILLRLLKNAAGLVLVVAGLLMLVLPGQGLLAIFMGITLLDFPGKRKFEHSIVRKRPVRAALDWIRTKAGKPPLLLP